MEVIFMLYHYKQCLQYFHEPATNFWWHQENCRAQYLCLHLLIHLHTRIRCSVKKTTLYLLKAWRSNILKISLPKLPLFFGFDRMYLYNYYTYSTIQVAFIGSRPIIVHNYVIVTFCNCIYGNRPDSTFDLAPLPPHP